MDVQVQAVVIQTIGQLFTEYLKSTKIKAKPPAEVGVKEFIENSYKRNIDLIDRPLPELPVITSHPIRQTIVAHDTNGIEPVKQLDENIEYPHEEKEETVLDGKAAGIATGCIPCSLGHFNTCSGLMNEAVRFAGKGMGSEEVVDRANMCLEELNSLERVDLRPAMIKQLSGWEQDLAKEALDFSRRTRHVLEGMTSPDDLIDAAATLQAKKQQIAREWFKNKLGNLTPEDQEEINRRLEAKLKELEEENGTEPMQHGGNSEEYEGNRDTGRVAQRA